MYYRSEAELSYLCDRRRFEDVAKAYEQGLVNPKDYRALYQVYLAYSMLQDADRATEVRQLLAQDMDHDASRDAILMRIRNQMPASEAEQTALVDAAHALSTEARDELEDSCRLAVALMTQARVARWAGTPWWAPGFIEAAFRLEGHLRRRQPKWLENIALWYLILGGRDKKRTRALRLAWRDPAWSRKLTALACYIFPPIGRFMPN